MILARNWELPASTDCGNTVVSIVGNRTFISIDDAEQRGRSTELIDALVHGSHFDAETPLETNIHYWADGVALCVCVTTNIERQEPRHRRADLDSDRDARLGLVRVGSKNATRRGDLSTNEQRKPSSPKADRQQHSLWSEIGTARHWFQFRICFLFAFHKLLQLIVFAPLSTKALNCSKKRRVPLQLLWIPRTAAKNCQT